MASTYSAGIVTAYGAAVRGGYTGTYEQFCQDQAGFAAAAQQVREDKESVEHTVQTFDETTVPAAVQSVTDEGTRQIGLVDNAGSTQVGNVNSAGTTQVGNVNQAGTTQVGLVQEEGATQVQAVEDKGEEVIESIPEDYSDLVDEVSDLNNAISDINSLTEYATIPFTNGGAGYINYTTGEILSSQTCYHTNYVDISNYTSIKYRVVTTSLNVYNSKLGIAFYDDQKAYVTGFNGIAGKPDGYYAYDDVLDVPNGVKFARFSFWLDTATFGDFYIYGISRLIDAAEITTGFVVNKNLFDKSTATLGKYVHTNNGNLVDYSNTFASDYIAIRRGTTYSFRVAKALYGVNAAVRLPIYDAEHNYIDYAGGTIVDEIVTVQIRPSTYVYSEKGNIPKYCRFTDYLDRIDTTMFVEGEYPTDYYEYGTDLLPESFGLNKKQVTQIQTITNTGVLYGKKIAYNGDSIAESRLAEGNSNNGGAYAKMIADITDGTYDNSAHGGGILASAVPSGTMPHSVISTLSAMPDNADLICFEGGINDYWRDVPLGDYSESDYTGTFDTTTVCGALESIFSQAKQKWVGKPICFVIVHKIKSTVYVANSAGWTFAQGREKMIGICNKYAIPYYDAYAESGLNAYNDIQNTTFLTSNTSGTADGCHPNAEGYKKYYVPQLIELFNKIMPRN